MGDTSRITIPIDVCSYERIRCPIELKSNVVHLKMGYTFTPSKYVLSYSTPYSSAKIPVTEDNISLFSIYSDVDMTVPGCYSVTYSLITGDGSMGYTRMIAIVEE